MNLKLRCRRAIPRTLALALAALALCLAGCGKPDYSSYEGKLTSALIKLGPFFAAGTVSDATPDKKIEQLWPAGQTRALSAKTRILAREALSKIEAIEVPRALESEHAMIKSGLEELIAKLSELSGHPGGKLVSRQALAALARFQEQASNAILELGHQGVSIAPYAEALAKAGVTGPYKIKPFDPTTAESIYYRDLRQAMLPIGPAVSRLNRAISDQLKAKPQGAVVRATPRVLAAAARLERVLAVSAQDVGEMDQPKIASRAHTALVNELRRATIQINGLRHTSAAGEKIDPSLWDVAHGLPLVLDAVTRVISSKIVLPEMTQPAAEAPSPQQPAGQQASAQPTTAPAKP